MDSQLNKIIDLIRKTGDKCVVLGKGNEAYVLMAFKDYEKLVSDRSGVYDLTENELLDKINRDIAIWRSSQEQENEIDLEEAVRSQIEREKEEENGNFPEEDRYYFEPIE